VGKAELDERRARVAELEQQVGRWMAVARLAFLGGQRGGPGAHEERRLGRARPRGGPADWGRCAAPTVDAEGGAAGGLARVISPGPPALAHAMHALERPFPWRPSHPPRLPCRPSSRR
jgi:hypothetical protein